MEDPNHAENCTVGRRCVSLRGDSHRHFHPHRCQHGIVISIPDKVKKRSRSRWNPCSRSPGIGVHDAMETAFTIDRNMHLIPTLRGEQRNLSVPAVGGISPIPQPSPRLRQQPIAGV
jgi:hypothetical protein